MRSPFLPFKTPSPCLLLSGGMKVEVKVSHSVLLDSLCPQGLEPTRVLCPWDYPGKITGVGCHFLLQGILLTQGLNPGLLHCRQILYHLSHQGSPPPDLSFPPSFPPGRDKFVFYVSHTASLNSPWRVVVGIWPL